MRTISFQVTDKLGDQINEYVKNSPLSRNEFGNAVLSLAVNNTDKEQTIKLVEESNRVRLDVIREEPKQTEQPKQEQPKPKGKTDDTK